MTANKKVDYNVKYALVGDSNVGKSSILHQLTKGVFPYMIESTIGVEYGSVIIKHKNKNVKIYVWDTAGQERFHAVCKSYYRGVAALLLIFDVNERRSFNHLDFWIKAIKKENSTAVITLIGNKIDLETKRVVSTEEGQAFADKHNIKYYEISAKSEKNVRTVFTETFTECLSTPDIYVKKYVYPVKVKNKKKKFIDEKCRFCCFGRF